MFPEEIEGVYIGDCCKEHDETCSAAKFFKCLSGKVSKGMAYIITIGGALGCFFRFGKY